MGIRSQMGRTPTQRAGPAMLRDRPWFQPCQTGGPIAGAPDAGGAARGAG